IKPELEAAVALSDRLQHPLSLLFVQGIMCNTLYLTHDLSACRASANEIARVATKYDLPVYGRLDRFGWARRKRCTATWPADCGRWSRHSSP
ncbi:MAG: hypothetical protein WCC50_00865, partial [Pseudolabrys sp.]